MFDKHKGVATWAALSTLSATFMAGAEVNRRFFEPQAHAAQIQAVTTDQVVGLRQELKELTVNLHELNSTISAQIIDLNRRVGQLEGARDAKNARR